MEETKHKIKIKRHSRRNWHAAAACLLSIALLVCLSLQYLSFVSKTIYAESTAHLEEVLHKSNNMLSMIVKKNISYLHVWNGFLSSDPDDASTQAYLESAQQQLGFAEFYFLSYDGNYMTPSGETGYLGLQSNLDELLSDQEDVVLNTALPGQDPMLVFICPETKGIYRGFAYDAIAISHYNNVVMKTVDDSAFGGAASSFVIYPDGQVVIENISEDSESIYNFIAILQEYSDFSEAQIQELTDDFAQGITGNREVTLDGTRFYMVYESTGIQNWILVGLVPRDTVNAAMNQLWQRTMQIVALVVLSIAAMVLLMVMHRGRTKLRRQNTAILYRDVLFEKLSQNVDDVFLLLDAQKHRADYVSPNIERLLGLTMKSVRKNIGTLALLYPADFPGRTKNYLEGLACGDQREWDTEFVHQKTGEHRWFHVVAMGSEVEGQIKHILVLSDRTADRQANQALSDAVAAAENANRAKSTFLSNMSHDIRTPMNAIIGFSDLLEKHIDEKDRAVDYIAKIKSSSSFLLSLINYVLEMARIESGKASLKIELGSYSELINSLNAVFEPSLKSKNLSYLCYNTVEHDAILCDRTKIREILLNIISNSIKYTPEGGKISVKIEETPAPRKGFASYRITVKDNGIGMSKEYLPHIFEEFTREHSSTESHITGTGLGLPIVKSLVNLMGGTIDVESELGAGTITTICLTFELPTEEQLAAHQHKDEILEQSLQTLSEKRVLLAEDNDLNAEIVLTVLEENGIHAEHVKDGALCLKAVQNAPEDYYNVILMDIQMPNMNGYQAAEAIRALPGKRGEIPIVAMTANAFEEDRRKALESGMNAHIAKPVDVSVLLETLSRFS